jgi:hypothetical protein
LFTTTQSPQDFPQSFTKVPQSFTKVPQNLTVFQIQTVGKKIGKKAYKKSNGCMTFSFKFNGEQIAQLAAFQHARDAQLAPR